MKDRTAKDLLSQWPIKTKLWSGNELFWLRCQPKVDGTVGPRLAFAGKERFWTQPDGLWVRFDRGANCDCIAIEVCGTVPNLNDKRSRYMPSLASIFLLCPRKWLDAPVYKGRHQTRADAIGIDSSLVKRRKRYPLSHLRVLYALPDDIYKRWKRNHSPTGYEFFMPFSSLGSYNSQGMQAFLMRLAPEQHFYSDRRVDDTRRTQDPKA